MINGISSLDLTWNVNLIEFGCSIEFLWNLIGTSQCRLFSFEYFPPRWPPRSIFHFKVTVEVVLWAIYCKSVLQWCPTLLESISNFKLSPKWPSVPHEPDLFHSIWIIQFNLLDIISVPHQSPPPQLLLNWIWFNSNDPFN